MSTSAIGTVLDSLRAALVALPALSGVNVASAPISIEDAGLEHIAFGDAQLAEAPLTMGGTRMETWTVEGGMEVSEQGSSEATIKSVRDRVLAIFAAVETYLNDTYTGTLPKVDITAGGMVQDFDNASRICGIVFTLTIKADKNP